ncbi:unnamed protein product [Lactuca saligna]|uniref:Uncharacterized protein n=1 Tax=Lactuca saligna TaxID=75948 RepID=A0AA35YB38_LACSI|nr:unnamed protein product [Lactuca saligna]
MPRRHQLLDQKKSRERNRRRFERNATADEGNTKSGEGSNGCRSIAGTRMKKADENEQLMGRKAARRFVARLAIGDGLRRSTRLKKQKDQSSEVAMTSDEKEETKQRDYSSSVLEVVAKGKEVRWRSGRFREQQHRR